MIDEKPAKKPDGQKPIAENPAGHESAAKPEPSAKQQKQAAQAEAESASPFSITVGRIYEGPLDLLLDLIRKQDIDIYDIPIAKITAQFLAYVEGLKQTDIDAAGDFIYVAAMLIQIKSRMLLPREPAEAEGESEDPRRELVERLLEHERFQRAAQMLLQKQQIEEATWTNPAIREFRGAEGTEPEIAADTVDLVRVFRDILERAKRRPVLNVDEDAVTVAQMLDFVRRRLVMEDNPVALRSLLKNTRSQRALICMFLALLEMVRLQAVLLRQDRNFGEIYVKKHESFDVVMDETMTRLRDDWR
jgi:segregation and condensation protein A